MARLLGRACFCFQRIAFILYFSFALRVQGYAISYTCDSVGEDEVYSKADVQAAIDEAKEIITLGWIHIPEPIPVDNSRDNLFPGNAISFRQVKDRFYRVLENDEWLDTGGDSIINFHCGFGYFVRESDPVLDVTDNGKSTVVLDQAEAESRCPPNKKNVYHILEPNPASGVGPKSHFIFCEGALPSYSSPMDFRRATILELQEEGSLVVGDSMNEVVEDALSVTVLFLLFQYGPMSEVLGTSRASIRTWAQCAGLAMDEAMITPASYIFYSTALMIHEVDPDLGVINGIVSPIGVIQVEDVSDSDDSSDTSSIFSIDEETKERWKKAFDEGAPDPDK